MNIVDKKADIDGKMFVTIWEQPELPDFDAMEYKARRNFQREYELSLLKRLNKNEDLLQQVLDGAGIDIGGAISVNLVVDIRSPELRVGGGGGTVTIRTLHWPHSRPVYEEGHGTKLVCPECGHSNRIPPSADVRESALYRCWQCGQQQEVKQSQHPCDGCWLCKPSAALSHEWDGGCGLYQ